jgi:WD40 repeat protein
MNKIVSFLAHDSYVLNLLFTRDGETLVSSGMDNVAKLWSAADWTATATYRGHRNSAKSISLAPDEQILVTGSSDQMVKL